MQSKYMINFDKYNYTNLYSITLFRQTQNSEKF